MKPNFALDLSPEYIVLLHQAQTGWQEVGKTRTDSPNLPQNLSYMRQTAVQLDPRGLATKLIIPASQVLFITAHAPGPGKLARIAQIRAALEGRTPYALDELRFDWREMGDQALVAAVALVTLQEAETFAKEYGFNPVSFAADGTIGGFPGETSFGQTAGAEASWFDGFAEPVSAFELTPDLAAKPAKGSTQDPDVVTPKTASQPVFVRASSHTITTPPPRDTEADKVIASSNDNPQLAPILSDANASLNTDNSDQNDEFAHPPTVMELFARAWANPTTRRNAGIAGAVAACLLVALLLWPAGDPEYLPNIPDGPVGSIPEVDSGGVTDTEPETSDPTPEIPNEEQGQIDSIEEEPATPEIPAIDYALTQPDETPPEDLIYPGDNFPPQVYVQPPDRRTIGHDAVALPATDPDPDQDQPLLLANPAPFVSVAPEPETQADDQIETADAPETVEPATPEEIAENTEPPALSEELQRLAGFRPAARPDNLTELVERERFSGLSRTELAQRRPAPRPDSPQSAQTEALDAIVLARSLRPLSRPNNFAALVTATRAKNAEAEQNRIANAAASAAATAVATSTANRQPQIPTSASVARQATFEGALDLRRTALIGVYGAPGNRRALVRMRNGRYHRVSVGDKLDGGVVAAISADRLEYTKGSRSVILQMPDG